MKLRSKLLVAQVPNGLALLLLGWLAVRSVTTLGTSSDLILRHNYRSVLAAQEMRESIERIDSATVFLVMGRREKALDQIAQHRPRFQHELEVERSNITEPGEEEAAADLEGSWKEYLAALESYVARGEGVSSELYFREMEPRFRKVKEKTKHVLDINQDAMMRRSEHAKRVAERVNRLMSVVAILAMLIGVMGSIAFTNRLLRPLDSLMLAVRRIGDHDLEMRAAVLGKDELGELAVEFNTMAARLHSYSQNATGRFAQVQRVTQATLDSVPYPVLTLAVDRQLIHTNQVARDLFHLQDISPGAPPQTQIAPEVRAVIEKTHQHVVQGRGKFVPQGFEDAVSFDAEDGQRFFLPHGMPLYGEGGVLMGVTIVLLDVTRLRRFDELRDDLVATVAHEFRTPLTSLHMAIHLCVEGKAGDLSEKQTELLFAAREDCERLQSLVDDLLNLARIQAGETEIHRMRFSPVELLEELSAAHQTLAASRQIQIKVEAPAMMPEVVADTESIRRVLANLVGNGLRYTPDFGKIILRVRPLPQAVRFEIEDSGPGIEPAHRDRVFDRFYRIPGQESHDRGAGLGLAIAKDLVERNGGQIGVESEPGRGSVFWFTLPQAEEEPGDPGGLPER